MPAAMRPLTSWTSLWPSATRSCSRWSTTGAASSRARRPATASPACASGWRPRAVSSTSTPPPAAARRSPPASAPLREHPVSEAGPVRLLIVDDETLVREGLASLLAIQEGIEVVGTAADGREAVELALATTPDVVLMDVQMPVVGGVQ